MATPGEKTNVIREVVKSELYNKSPLSQIQSENPNPPNLAEPPSPPHHSYHLLLPPEGVTDPVLASTSEMGVSVRCTPRLSTVAHEGLGTVVTPTSLSQSATGKSEVKMLICIYIFQCG